MILELILVGRFKLCLKRPWGSIELDAGVSVDWSSPGLHHSMKKCDAGELHGSTHMQTFECGSDTGSDCRKA